MRATLKTLAEHRFDVLVVGGGACGAATAREAALRGFDTALIERDDFGGGASAHCFKVVHGGIRYLQHADLPRMRASCRERSIFLKIAPHLVSPMPFVIPTYGQGRSSKWFLGAGMLVYDALTADCNRLVHDASRRVKRTQFLNRVETLAHFPTIDERGLTGATIFEDGQMYNPPRLVLGFAAAAAQLGATVANYVEASHLIVEGDRVVGVRATDQLTGDRFDIRAKLVINAAGPWAEGVLGTAAKVSPQAGVYSRDACFLISRKPAARLALAVQGQSSDADAVLARSARHLFLVPWRDFTLVGVWHAVVPREPDSVGLTRAELNSFIDEVNRSYPKLHIQQSEVQMAGFGLVPFGAASAQQPKALSFGKQSRITDHAAQDGLAGLISVISVRYTVARMDAVKALDLACTQLGASRSSHDSEQLPLPGGDIENFAHFSRELQASRPGWLSAAACEALAQNYGTHTQKILALASRDPSLQRLLPDSQVSLAEIAHSVREEMAARLSDVVFRRTELGTAGHPGEPALSEAQAFMGRELQWSAQRAAAERAAVDRHFERYLGMPR